MVSLFKRERGQVDAANDKSDRCTGFYETLREELARNGN